MFKRYIQLGCLSLTLIMLGYGCASSPSQPIIVSANEIYLKDLCRRYNVELQWDSVSQVVTLNYDGQKASALVGSNVVVLNGESITLSDSIKTVRSAVVVPADFKRKVIDRFVQRRPQRVDYRVREIKRVIIDAGHGGKDPGAIGHSGLQEKKVVLDIATRVKRILEKKGIKVIMTRRNDTFISLQERTQIASRTKADLFISIHANASLTKSAMGLEIFTLKNLNTKEKNEQQRRDNEKLLFKKMSMVENDKRLNKIVADMLYDHKQAESVDLAGIVLKNTRRVTKAKDRGLKSSRFYVLRNTMVPSILVEVGFLSNPREEKLLRTKKYRQRVAYGVATSILDYAKGQ